MASPIKKLWNDKPEAIILFSALFVRLLAAIFSKGFGMYDDHFLVIEVAQRWVEGCNDWFDSGKASGHSIVYPGLHYILFYFLEKIGMSDPQQKMFIVRFIHAMYSMLIVWFGYLTALKLSDRNTARKVGMALALFWLLPFMSVRNLIEMVCIPPLVIGFYLAVTSENKKPSFWIVIGLVFGLSFMFRYQTLSILGCVPLVLFFQKKWMQGIYYSAGLLVSIFITQGLTDWIAWGAPFASFFHYVHYNTTSYQQYILQPWYNYILLILGVFIPPFSFLIFGGYLANWKKRALIFYPTLLFLSVHSYFPAKQERFILPILPFIIILGMIGWEEFYKKSSFGMNKRKLVQSFWAIFWVFNTILLLASTFHYSKKSRVESLTYLSKKKDVAAVIFENSKRGVPRPPQFYIHNPEIEIFKFSDTDSVETIRTALDTTAGAKPNYIVFLTDRNLEKRKQRFADLLDARLLPETTISPSLMDQVLHALNPKHNVNLTSYIFRIEADSSAAIREK